jgi:predicted dehydrogenase
MIDIGVHVIEMAHYLLGSPKPVAASGNVWTYLGNKESKVVSRWRCAAASSAAAAASAALGGMPGASRPLSSFG